MPYIGKQPLTGAYQLCDAIVTSATATYNLLVGGSGVIPGSANNCIVSLNGVVQAPVGAFTVSGSQITFASTLSATDVIDFILILGNVFDIGTPTNGAVTNSSLNSNVITGQTAETTIAGGDLVLLYDDSASALRKMTRTNFVSGLGAAAGQVIQVVQGTRSTATTTTSASFVTTNIEASITPSSASNKVFVIATFFSSVPTGAEGIYSIFRDSTNLISTGDNALGQNYSAGGRVDYMSCLSFLDSPSTTSSVTYSIRFLAQSGTLTTTGESTTSVINLMEIKG